ncbi:MAG: putative electron transport protein YccM [Alphaproteobacteria bacterium ADurb.Bin438]|nr:MAG: putative electron transport protein YccM [Alphaproteobacteria bacterium ADurb.Bin438]
MKKILKNKITLVRFLSRFLFVIALFFGLVSWKILSIFILISAIVIGPLFCGWLCPYGFYQDVCRYIGKFIRKKPFEINDKWHKYLQVLRYVVFILSLIIGGLFLLPSDILKSFSYYIAKKEVAINGILYFMIFVGFLSLFTKRFFCRYLCIFGARQGLISLFRIFTIKRDKNECISCRLCTKECLMKITVDDINTMYNPNCVNCYKCIEVCPKKCLKIGLRNYKDGKELFIDKK